MVGFPASTAGGSFIRLGPLECGIEEVDDVFDRTMVEWRAFFSRWGAPLSPEEQRGLIGELLVLEEMLSAGNPKVPRHGRGQPIACTT